MSQVTWSGEDCDRTKEQEAQQCHRSPGQVETDMTQEQETQQCRRLPGQVETVIGQDTRTGDPAMSQVTLSGGD